MQPSAHFYLRDEFVHFDGRRVFVGGGRSVRLDPVERAVVSCLVRGESELGVLAQALAELEIGGEPERLAAELLARYAGPASLIQIEPPQDVIEPEVIVTSFSADYRHLDLRRLLERLRRRFRVLHVGRAENVRGEARSNVVYQVDKEASRFRSPFRMVQWARSIVRFHTRAALVMTGPQDLILFGDLAATHQSLLALGTDWPPRTGIQDLLGGEALLTDPLPGLRALFYALRMTALQDYARISYAYSSELAWLELYAVRHARDVAFGLADQPRELARVGRAAGDQAPLCLAPGRISDRPARTGVLAVVLDMEYFARIAPVLAALHAGLPQAGLESLVLRTDAGWFDVTVTDVLRAVPKPAQDARPEVAILAPGLIRRMDAAIQTLSEGIPTLCYPTQLAHPLLEHAPPGWTAASRSTEDWAGELADLRRPDSPRRKLVLGHARALIERWDLVDRVERLVEAARQAGVELPSIGSATRTAAAGRAGRAREG